MNYQLKHQIGDTVYEVKRYNPIDCPTFEEALIEDTVKTIIISEELGGVCYSCIEDVEHAVERRLYDPYYNVFTTKEEARKGFEETKAEWKQDVDEIKYLENRIREYHNYLEKIDRLVKEVKAKS